MIVNSFKETGISFTYDLNSFGNIHHEVAIRFDYDQHGKPKFTKQSLEALRHILYTHNAFHIHINIAGFQENIEELANIMAGLIKSLPSLKHVNFEGSFANKVIEKPIVVSNESSSSEILNLKETRDESVASISSSDSDKESPVEVYYDMGSFQRFSGVNTAQEIEYIESSEEMNGNLLFYQIITDALNTSLAHPELTANINNIKYEFNYDDYRSEEQKKYYANLTLPSLGPISEIFTRIWRGWIYILHNDSEKVYFTESINNSSLVGVAPSQIEKSQELPVQHQIDKSEVLISSFSTDEEDQDDNSEVFVSSFSTMMQILTYNMPAPEPEAVPKNNCNLDIILPLDYGYADDEHDIGNVLTMAR